MTDVLADGDLARTIAEAEVDAKDEISDDEVRAAYASYLSEGTAHDAIGRQLCRIALGELCVATDRRDTDGRPVPRYPTVAERWWARRRLSRDWRRHLPAGRARWDTLSGSQVTEMLSWPDEHVRREAVVAARGGHAVGADRADQALRVLAGAWNERLDAASRAVYLSISSSSPISPSELSTIEGALDPVRGPRRVRLTRILVSDPDLDRIVLRVQIGDDAYGHRIVEAATRDGSRTLLLPERPCLERGEKIQLVVSAVGPEPVFGIAALAVGEVELP